MTTEHPVILFDGICNLCSGSVQFILKRDKKKLFRFASLQSGYGQKILQEKNLPVTNFNSFILYENGEIFTKSTGALKVFSRLRHWQWSRIFFIVPPFIRDAIYTIIANNRYKWFGKKEECWLPSPELKERFYN